MGLCKLPQQEDKGTAAMMRPVSPSMKEMIGNYRGISVLEWRQMNTKENCKKWKQISCPDLFEWKNFSEFQYLIRVIHWYGDRYIQENHEKSKSGTMRRQLWQKRFWGGLPCRARVAAPECDEYIRIYWSRIYIRTFVHIIFFHEYNRTFVRVKFVCTNIFGHSLVSVLECKT